MFCGFHHGMGLAGPIQRQHGIGDGTQRTNSEMRPDLRAKIGGNRRFERIRARPQGGAGIGDAFQHDRHQVDFNL